MYLGHPMWLRLLFVLRRVSVDVDSLFYVPHKVCGGLCWSLFCYAFICVHFYFCDHLDEEARDECFLMSCLICAM